MGISKKMFDQEQEKKSVTLEQYLENELKEAEYYAESQKQVLNKIFDSWEKIFSEKSKNTNN
jgi:replication-associated recombination protein RarA